MKLFSILYLIFFVSYYYFLDSLYCVRFSQSPYIICRWRASSAVIMPLNQLMYLWMGWLPTRSYIHIHKWSENTDCCKYSTFHLSSFPIIIERRYRGRTATVRNMICVSCIAITLWHLYRYILSHAALLYRGKDRPTTEKFFCHSPCSL